MPSDYGTYNLVQSTIKQAEELGFELKWYTEGWRLETGTTIAVGDTVMELLQFLNGYYDAKLAAVSVAAKDNTT